MNRRPNHWPADFATYSAIRTWALDRLAAAALLDEIERQADAYVRPGDLTDPGAAGSDPTSA